MSGLGTPLVAESPSARFTRRASAGGVSRSGPEGGEDPPPDAGGEGPDPQHHDHRGEHEPDEQAPHAEQQHQDRRHDHAQDDQRQHGTHRQQPGTGRGVLDGGGHAGPSVGGGVEDGLPRTRRAYRRVATRS